MSCVTSCSCASTTTFDGITSGLADFFGFCSFNISLIVLCYCDYTQYLYWLIRLLDRRPAAEDCVFCHTGTLALRVHIVRPGRLHHIFICCVCIDRSFVRCIAQYTPPATHPACRWRMRASMCWIQQCIPIQWVVAPLPGATLTIQ